MYKLLILRQAYTVLCLHLYTYTGTCGIIKFIRSDGMRDDSLQEAETSYDTIVNVYVRKYSRTNWCYNRVAEDKVLILCLTRKPS